MNMYDGHKKQKHMAELCLSIKGCLPSYEVLGSRRKKEDKMVISFTFGDSRVVRPTSAAGFGAVEGSCGLFNMCVLKNICVSSSQN